MMTMTTIAAIAAEYELGELTALDLLGLEPEDANTMLDGDQEKRAREVLNAATGRPRVIRTTTPERVDTAARDRILGYLRGGPE